MKKIDIYKAPLERGKKVYLKKEILDLIDDTYEYNKKVSTYEVLGHAVIDETLYYIINLEDIMSNVCKLHLYDDFLLPEEAEKIYKEYLDNKFNKVFK